MGAESLDALADIIDDVDTSEKTLLLVNLTDAAAAPQTSMLERVFDAESVSVAERHPTEGQENLVCLIEDGEVVATSPWAELKRAFLLINTDRYRTGTTQIETGSFPDVLTGLDDIEFTVRGYPESNKEKLLLVVISRFIEFQALSAGAGEFDASFQYLSRLDDEYGTRRVYEWLGDSGVESHVYGIRDDPRAVDDLDVIVHANDDPELRRLWFVVFTPPQSTPADGDGGEHVALVAEETGPNVWRGLWTYDPDRVRQAQSYVRQRF